MYLDTMLCLVVPAVFVVRAGWAVAADLVRAIKALLNNGWFS